MSSWYYYHDNALYVSEYAPFVDGWVEIQKSDKETYTITFSLYDDLKNNITGTFTSEAPAMISGVLHPAISL